MKQILVAVDEHPHAEQVVESAIQLARVTSAKIILTYVVAKNSVPEKYRDLHGDALPEHYYQDLFQRTVGPLVERIEAAGMECETVFEAGNPEKGIMKMAKSKGVDYIVVGIHGFRGLSRLKAIGNVARNIIETSDIPVLAVP